MRYEKHSYLVNRCIGASNVGLYWIHLLLEVVNSFIVFWALMITFDERIDADLIFFILYLACGIGHFAHYLKKFIDVTISMVTGETLHERQFGLKIHYKNDK